MAHATNETFSSALFATKVMPTLTPSQWLLAAVAAMCIGIAKSGFSGVGMFPVAVFAELFGAKASTGRLLPLLIVGDISAVTAFGRSAHWTHLRRVLPPAAIGVVVGWYLMDHIDEVHFRPVIGYIILTLAIMQIARMLRPRWFELVPHSVVFAWLLGLLVGITTMLANAAGPIVALYLLALSLPKQELVGTSAWFFLLMNVYKIPFSFGLGLIDRESLTMNLILAPMIFLGTFTGRRLITLVPQRLFDAMLLTFVSIAALRLIGVF